MGLHDLGCRFTWDVIKRHRDQCAIVLTTHSMVSSRGWCQPQLLAGWVDPGAVGRQPALGLWVQACSTVGHA